MVAETESGNIAGCIAYRELTTDTIEMHRVSVDVKFRRLGIGRKMVQVLLDMAKQNGYDTVYLDTPTSEIAARTLYERMNFTFLKLISRRLSPTEANVLPLTGRHRIHFYVPSLTNA